jgi:hypothetical protein
VRAFVEALRAEYGDGTSDPWWPLPTTPAPARRSPPKPPAARQR